MSMKPVFLSLSLVAALGAAEVKLISGIDALATVSGQVLTPERFDAPDQSGQALRLTPSRVAEQEWQSSIKIEGLLAGVEASKSVRVSFIARRANGEAGRAELKTVVIQRYKPWGGVASRKFTIGADWVPCTFTMPSKLTLEADQLTFTLQSLSAIDIARLEVVTGEP